MLRAIAVTLFAAAALMLVLGILSWFARELEPLRDFIQGSFVAYASAIALLLVLGAFADFESDAGSPRDLAAMASLAGLSVAARIPFAAIPNVQPCTFLILAGGYVFGSRRGFMIGAVTALVSNFYLGQGPWTLWQMLGWGLVGASGGLLARAHGVSGAGVPDRRSSPNPVLSGRKLASFVILAVAWGFLYGWLLNLWMFMFFPLELRFLLLIMLTGFPFDLAHAAGNAVFALTLGPFVVDNLMRARERWTVVYLDDIPDGQSYSEGRPVTLVAQDGT